MARAIASLRARGERLELAAVARALLACAVAPPPEVARRVVAAALGRSAHELSDPLAPEDLEPRAPAPAWAATPLAQAEFHVVDLETTGLSRTCEILEIGAVHVAAGRRVAHFFTLVRPSGPVPAKITALTGIDDALVREAPPAAECLARFRAWLDRAPGAPFVAHNAPFDAGFVARGFARQGLRPLDVPVLCTRKLARRALPALGRFGLDRVCEHLAIRNGARHRAAGDAAATAELLLALLERVRVAQHLETLGDLERFLRSPPVKGALTGDERGFKAAARRRRWSAP